MDNETAYRELVKLCEQKGWWATHTALVEGGCSGIDCVKMLEDWTKEEVTSER